MNITSHKNAMVQINMNTAIQCGYALTMKPSKSMVDCCGVYMGPFAVDKITTLSPTIDATTTPQSLALFHHSLPWPSVGMRMSPILIPKGTNHAGRCRWNWPITARISIYWLNMPASARLVGRCACVVIAAAQLVVDKSLRSTHQFACRDQLEQT